MTADAFSKLRLRRLHDVLAGYVERGDVPGVVAGLCRRGDTHVEVIGRAAAGGAALRRDSIFRISSMTKPITAVAAMILVEDCKLRLDDPVDRLLPELAGRRVLTRLDAELDDTVPAKRPITLRDLLTFRLGFGQVMAPPESCRIAKAAHELQIGMGPPQPQGMPAADEWLRRLGSLPLMHQPGESWMYNTGADVLGVLIARAAGQPLETFLRERLFAPLGMTDTAFGVPAAKLDRFTTSYWRNFATGATEVYDAAAGGQWSKPPVFASGGAGLVSTLDDYLAFGRMMLNFGRHGEDRLLSRSSVETMTVDHLTPAQKAASIFVPGFFDGRGWGFGVAVTTRRDDPSAPVGQYGWAGGLGTCWSSDPGEDLALVLMTGQAWTSPSPPPICRDFWTLAYQAIDD